MLQFVTTPHTTERLPVLAHTRVSVGIIWAMIEPERTVPVLIVLESAKVGASVS